MLFPPSSLRAPCFLFCYCFVSEKHCIIGRSRRVALAVGVIYVTHLFYSDRLSIRPEMFGVTNVQLVASLSAKWRLELTGPRTSVTAVICL